MEAKRRGAHVQRPPAASRRLRVLVAVAAAGVPGSRSAAFGLQEHQEDVAGSFQCGGSCSSANLGDQLRPEDSPDSAAEDGWARFEPPGVSLLQTGWKHVAVDTAEGAFAGSTQVRAVGACSYGPHVQQQPFLYWHSNASNAADSRTPAPPVPEGASGLCVFPAAAASCGGAEGCCASSDWVTQGSIWAELSAAGVSLISTILIIIGSQMRKRTNPNRDASVGSTRDVINDVALVAGFFVNLNAGVLMARSTQAVLKVGERNSMLSATAFLTPIQEVFQFLEDAVTVKIGFAIGSGDAEAVAAVLILGVAGGLVLGSLAAAFTTIVAWWPAVAYYALTPGDFGSSCTLSQSMSQGAEGARAFWLYSSWSWPLSFAGMALTGFLLGSRENGVFFLAMLLSKATLVALWFGLRPQDLPALGRAQLSSGLVFLVTCFVATLVYTPLRNQYSWSTAKALFSSKRALASSQSQGGMIGIIGSQALQQGLQAMVLEVCVQGALSSAVVAARSLGADAMYQVSAMQAAMPLFGGLAGAPVAYATRLTCSIIIGRGEFHLFAPIFRALSLLTGLVCLGLVFAIVPFRTQMAFHYAEQACVFAAEPSCTSLYRGVFGGSADGVALRDSFLVFTASAVSMVIFTFLKSTLYGCLDFEFLAKAGVVAFVGTYIPALVVAHRFFQSAAALYAAAHVPVVILCVAFCLRVHWNITRMGRNEPGPWSAGDSKTPLSEMHL